MTRWRIELAYDGTDFHGWAAQPGLRTVEGVLTDWLARILRVGEVQLTVAGRTDAGVHARAQVAHLDVPAECPLSPDEASRRLRGVLPRDIVVRAIDVAPPGFDARFAASWRRYCYRCWDDESAPDPLHDTNVLRWSGSLDIAAMQAGAQTLLGLRDFVPFAKPKAGATTIRELQRFEIQRTAPSGTIEAWLQADAFCHHMVRSLMGAITAIGAGRRDLDWLRATAALNHRAGDVTVLPARGLTLELIGYPPAAEYAERTAQARARREPTA